MYSNNSPNLITGACVLRESKTRTARASLIPAPRPTTTSSSSRRTITLLKRYCWTGSEDGRRLSQQSLKNYAAALGSDCPFFILNKPCYATGRGEILEEISLDLSAHKILMVNPGIHINTGWAFSQLVFKEKRATDLNELVQQPISSWRKNIANDFELPVFTAHPEIEIIINNLYAYGAIYASMSGSGSSVYGIFEKDNHPVMNFKAHYFYRWA